MDYEYLLNLRSHNTAWRLIAANNAPLILSFLYATFIEKNIRSISRPDLLDALDRTLIILKQRYGEQIAKGSANQYLDDWSDPRLGYLRMYYPTSGDEPLYDITAAVEKALQWISGLEKRQFVGTESRLVAIFDLLNDVVLMSSNDPEVRLRDLDAQKSAIEAEIAEIKAGHLRQYDGTQLKERYFQLEDGLRHLISDFRQVEENFRQLDRSMRETITGNTFGKGLILDQVFQESDDIESSDQGRSFASFWEFLMSTERQELLQVRLEQLFAIEELDQFKENSLLAEMKYRLITSGAHIKEVLNGLSAELRRFLSQPNLLENRRIVELCRHIEKVALELGEKTQNICPPKLAGDRIAINPAMMRTLFNPEDKTSLKTSNIQVGAADRNDAAILLNQHFVDHRVLRDQINHCLNGKHQVLLSDVVATYPIRKGVAELVVYLNIASDSKGAYWDQGIEEMIEVQQENINSWTTTPHDNKPEDRASTLKVKKVILPQVVFTEYV